MSHRFFAFNGREVDFDTWIRLRDEVRSEWVIPGKVLVSTLFRGDNADGEVVLWETRATILPGSSYVAGRYTTHDAAVRGDARGPARERLFGAVLGGDDPREHPHRVDLVGDVRRGPVDLGVGRGSLVDVAGGVGRGDARG